MSRNGVHGDALNSMLQKSIRRGETKYALAAAYEMYVTSADYLEMLWLRLQCIAIEDIGFGSQTASRQVRMLDEMRREFPYDDPSQALFFIQAIRYLCRCTKERTSDHLRGMLTRAFNNGYVPQVPAWDDDKTVTPALEDEEITAIHTEYLEMLKTQADSVTDAEIEPMKMNDWKY